MGKWCDRGKSWTHTCTADVQSGLGNHTRPKPQAEWKWARFREQALQLLLGTDSEGRRGKSTGYLGNSKEILERHVTSGPEHGLQSLTASTII